MKVKSVHAFWGRQNFGKFLNGLGLRGKAVEVGTDLGGFADQLLNQWTGEILYCVDPYRDPDTPSKRLLQAQSRLAKYGNRVVFLVATSEEAVKEFADNSLDFVYIDGDHHYELVRFDLYAWWEKVRVGGLLAGHDIRSVAQPGRGWDQYVLRALREFCADLKIPAINLVREKSRNWSFYLTKPETAR